MSRIMHPFVRKWTFFPENFEPVMLLIKTIKWVFFKKSFGMLYDRSVGSYYFITFT